jgi:hypothetical protein
MYPMIEQLVTPVLGLTLHRAITVPPSLVGHLVVKVYGPWSHFAWQWWCARLQEGWGWGWGWIGLWPPKRRSAEARSATIMVYSRPPCDSISSLKPL